MSITSKMGEVHFVSANGRIRPVNPVMETVSLVRMLRIVCESH